VDYSPFGPTASSVAYWIFLGVVVVVAITSRYLRQREVQKTIRKAIEAGQPLDPDLLDRLQAMSALPGMGARSPMRQLRSAVILVACGPALWLIAFFQSIDRGRLNFTLIGIGAAIALIGLVLTGLALWALRREPRNDE
jgi:hypothetical protein